jgi:acetyltransferase-like isoleucine patch superfamily enzyme
VTGDVAPNAVVVGNPARPHGGGHEVVELEIPNRKAVP